MMTCRACHGPSMEAKGRPLLPKLHFKPFRSYTKAKVITASRSQPRKSETDAHTSGTYHLNAKAAAATDGIHAKEECGDNPPRQESRECSVMRRAWLIASAGTTLGVGVGELLMLLAETILKGSCHWCLMP